MVEPNIYYKILQPDMTSFWDKNFKYTMGLNIHPSPNIKTREICSEGIHLAKLLHRNMEHDARIVFLAKAGVILAGDSTKVRCSYCWLVKQLTEAQISLICETEKKKQSVREYKMHKKAKHEANMKKLLGSVFENGGLPGHDWVTAHWNDVTQDDIDRQILQVSCAGTTKNIPPTLKKKDMRVLLQSIRREE